MDEKTIADVLREIASEARPPRPDAERVWRAGRRRRRAGLGAAGLGVAAVAAAVIVPLAATSATQTVSAQSAARPPVITLRSPLRLAQVTSVTFGRCGATRYPWSIGHVCFALSRTETMTVHALRSDGVIASRTSHGFMVTVRLLPGDASKLATLSRLLDRYDNPPAVRGELGILYRGVVIDFPQIDGPITNGELHIGPFQTRAEAEALLKSLNLVSLGSRPPPGGVCGGRRSGAAERACGRGPGS